MTKLRQQPNERGEPPKEQQEVESPLKLTIH